MGSPLAIPEKRSKGRQKQQCKEAANGSSMNALLDHTYLDESNRFDGEQIRSRVSCKSSHQHSPTPWIPIGPSCVLHFQLRLEITWIFLPYVTHCGACFFGARYKCGASKNTGGAGGQELCSRSAARRKTTGFVDDACKASRG